jgi:hypothetical protein
MHPLKFNEWVMLGILPFSFCVQLWSIFCTLKRWLSVYKVLGQQLFSLSTMIIFFQLLQASTLWGSWLSLYVPLSFCFCCLFLEAGSCCVAQTGLILMILPASVSQCWNSLIFYLCLLWLSCVCTWFPAASHNVPWWIFFCHLSCL